MPRPLDQPSAFPIVLAGFTAFLGLYATQPLLPLLARVFHASPFDVSLTVTVPTLAVAIAAPVAGRLGDRFGRRQTIVVAAAAMAVTTALAALSTGLRQLLVWRFLQGLMTPGVFAVTIAYIHDQWPRTRVGSAVSAYISGTVVGGFCGRVLVGVVAERTSWQTAFVVLAIVNAATAAALWRWLPVGRAAPSRGSETRPGRRGALVGHLRTPELLTAYGVGFCVLFTIVAMFTYVTFRLAAPPFHLSTAALGYLFVVYLAGAVMTTAAGSRLDRYGHRQSLVAAAAIGIVGTLITLGPTVPLIGLGLAVCCSGLFVAQAVATSHVGAIATEDRGVAVGLYATFYYIGGSVGGALPAIFWNAGGWPACVALAVVVQMAMAAIGYTFWRDPAHQPV